MDNKRTILLADANEEFRSMLRENIEKSEEFTVVGGHGGRNRGVTADQPAAAGFGND